MKTDRKAPSGARRVGMTWTPIELHCLLFCYSLHNPNKQLGDHLPASDARAFAIDKLARDGLIDADMKATERGRALVDLLCRTPLPVALWIDPREDGESVAQYPGQAVVIDPEETAQ